MREVQMILRLMVSIIGCSMKRFLKFSGRFAHFFLMRFFLVLGKRICFRPIGRSLMMMLNPVKCLIGVNWAEPGSAAPEQS